MSSFICQKSASQLSESKFPKSSPSSDHRVRKGTFHQLTRLTLLFRAVGPIRPSLVPGLRPRNAMTNAGKSGDILPHYKGVANWRSNCQHSFCNVHARPDLYR